MLSRPIVLLCDPLVHYDYIRNYDTVQYYIMMQIKFAIITFRHLSSITESRAQ
jgi:hypothetical protein